MSKPLTRDQRSLLSLRGIVSGPGAGLAPRVLACLVARLHWRRSSDRKSKARCTWVGNDKIAKDLDVSPREVQTVITALKSSGAISTSWARKHGVFVRLITIKPDLDPSISVPVFRLPDQLVMREIAAALEGDSPRVVPGVQQPKTKPGPTLSLAFVLMCVASIEQGGGEVTGPIVLSTSLACLREITGTSERGGGFNARLDRLAAAGIIRRAGARWSDGIELTPPSVRQPSTDRPAEVRTSATGLRLHPWQRSTDVPAWLRDLDECDAWPAVPDLSTMPDWSDVPIREPDDWDATGSG